MIYGGTRTYNPLAEDVGMFADLIPGGGQEPAYSGYSMPAYSTPTAADVFTTQMYGQPVPLAGDVAATNTPVATATPTDTTVVGRNPPLATADEIAQYNGLSGTAQTQHAVNMVTKYGPWWFMGSPVGTPGSVTDTAVTGTPATGAIDPVTGLPVTGTPATGTPVTGTPTTGTTTPAAAQPTATDMIRNTPGYLFQYNEGLKALNANAYARGLGNSGATFRALEAYGQNHADNYYQQYLNNVMAVAEQGRGAASAIAGSGGAMGSGVAGALNNSAQAIQNGANGQINAINNIGNANASMWTGIGGAVGKAAGTIFGSSY